MSYEPTNWKTGDVVTSAKLNKLENGVANGAGFLKVAASYDDQTQVNTMDKTWQEIYDALANGEHVSLMEFIQNPLGVFQYQIIGAGYVPVLLSDGYYDVTAVQFRYGETSTSITTNLVRFTCATANDYPQYSSDEGE